MQTCLLTPPAIAPFLASEDEPSRRLDELAVVFSEIMAPPDKGIPEELLEKAQCIVVVPGMKKGAFIVRGKTLSEVE